jgi:hypothetical protein
MINWKLNIAAIGLGFALLLTPQVSQAGDRDNGNERDGRRENYSGNERDGRRENYSDNYWDHERVFHKGCERFNIRYVEREHDHGHDGDCRTVSPN